ncbi:MAG: hypothetical protein AAB909_00960 [Patescibacteria group bacterium]
MNYLENLPFRKPDKLIGSSRKTEVYGFEPEGLVVKIPKVGSNQFESVDQAREDVLLHRTLIERVSGLMEKSGGMRSTMFPDEAVIHKDGQGRITYARVQPYLKHAVSLSDLGMKIIDMSKKDLEELKRIFKINIDLWKNEGVYLDMVGSTASKRNFFLRKIKRLLPLFFSENIMIDKQKGLFMVDVGVLEETRTQGFRKKLRGIVQYMGSELSVRIIDRMLARKKNNE